MLYNTFILDIITYLCPLYYLYFNSKGKDAFVFFWLSKTNLSLPLNNRLTCRKNVISIWHPFRENWAWPCVRPSGLNRLLYCREFNFCFVFLNWNNIHCGYRLFECRSRANPFDKIRSLKGYVLWFVRWFICILVFPKWIIYC
jgi:hypothetical protein